MLIFLTKYVFPFFHHFSGKICFEKSKSKSFTPRNMLYFIEFFIFTFFPLAFLFTPPPPPPKKKKNSFKKRKENSF